jgi:glucan phosphoethanolaminetransferase (alkaline phosphatase superfamily)
MKKSIWNTDLIVLLLSCFVFIFWMISVSIDNVYDYMVTGALYELLALPTLALGIVLPIIIVYRMFRRSFKSVLIPILSLLFLLVTFLMLYFKEKPQSRTEYGAELHRGLSFQKFLCNSVVKKSLQKEVVSYHGFLSK